jgi:hypothetical protein
MLYRPTTLAPQNVRMAGAFGWVSWPFDAAGYSRNSANSNTNSAVQLAYQKCYFIQEHMTTFLSFPCPPLGVIRRASYCDILQCLEFPLNELRSQSRAKSNNMKLSIRLCIII